MTNSNIHRRKTIPTRRDFVRRLVQLLTYGGLSHFSLSGNQAMAASTEAKAHVDCQGGAPTADICIPPEDYDYCPGETSATDVCPDNGNRNEDECNSGLPNIDICDAKTSKSDQCQSGMPNDDQCKEDGIDIDYCPSGHSESDICPNDGNISDGDECPGGGIELDTCLANSVGDECGSGTWGTEDDCNNSQTDICATVYPLSITEDDTCYNGSNMEWNALPNGGEDWCRGNFLASDDCTTGIDEDDLCQSNKDGDGAFDVCPGGEANVDRCDDNSDDYCVTGIKYSDNCTEGLPPEDVCAKSIQSEDTCFYHTAGSDECDPLISEGDQNGCKSYFDDTCFILDKCNDDNRQDIPE